MFFYNVNQKRTVINLIKNVKIRAFVFYNAGEVFLTRSKILNIYADYKFFVLYSLQRIGIYLIKTLIKDFSIFR